MSIAHNRSSQVAFDAIQLHPEIRNYRGELGDLSEIAESLTKSGQRIPLTVWRVRKDKKSKAKYFLVGGFRRYHAMQMVREKGFKGPDGTK